MSTHVITPPALSANPVADRIFDAVFDHSSEFRIRLDFDSAVSFIRRIGEWNEFQPEVVIEELENIDRRIPRTYYGPGNPNNGQRTYTLSVGRENSPVIVLERYEFDHGAASRLSDGDIRAICDTMEYIARADEAHADVHELPAGFGGRKVTFRFWWD